MEIILPPPTVGMDIRTSKQDTNELETGNRYTVKTLSRETTERNTDSENLLKPTETDRKPTETYRKQTETYKN